MTAEASPIALTPDELATLTGYRLASRQLPALHRAGFVRARLVHGRVLLERAHYEAICGGAREKERPRLRLEALRAA